MQPRSGFFATESNVLLMPIKNFWGGAISSQLTALCESNSSSSEYNDIYMKEVLICRIASHDFELCNIK